MSKTGIITFHYSNNYGGVLQAFALYKYLEEQSIDVEIINYVPLRYKNEQLLHATGIKQNLNPLKDFKGFYTSLRRIYIKAKYKKNLIKKFNEFRLSHIKMSNRVSEDSLEDLLNSYETIVVGSDQIWGPSERKNKEYFLGYENLRNVKKISYAADSTLASVDAADRLKLANELMDFDEISVRNDHSNDFVMSLIGKKGPVVVDPTLLYDFNNLALAKNEEKYILVYCLGSEIKGSNKLAIEKIKEAYGDLKVYAVTITTMKFNIINYADKVFYDLSPREWLTLFKNATFIFTDSYHGTLFSLKFHKPFLSYYTEEIRSTRFLDLAKRYKINNFIVDSIEDLNAKHSLTKAPDFNVIDDLINKHRKISEEFIKKTLR